MSSLEPSSPSYDPLVKGIQSRIKLFLKRMGYHFSLVKATYPNKVNLDSEIVVEMVWKNSGVAPFYFSWPLELSLTR